jgi:Fe-S cluster biogenesis protein NfuA
MFIQTEATPNPATIKFIPGQIVLDQGRVAEFKNGAAAKGQSPLAERLFKIDGIESVFFSSDFVSITKHEGKEWLVLKPLILGALFEHFSSGVAVLSDTYLSAADENLASEEDSEIVEQIKEILETRVRPAVARDGGDIVFHKFDKGILWLQLRGACSGCPSSTLTLKSGIENMMRHFLPEVLEVRAVAD